MTARTCSIDGCDRPYYGRGWCGMHYQRWRLTGEIGPARARRPAPATCELPGCDKPYSSKGLCDMHRNRLRRNGSVDRVQRIVGDDTARFWSYVDKDGPTPQHRPELGPCWIWTGGLNGGYGHINSTTVNISLAHRFSWHLNIGPVPDDICVLHHCDNPPCVRPEHLFLGEKADNTADMISKGRDRFEPGVQALRGFHVGTDNPQAKMTEELVVELRQRAAAGEYFRDLAPEFGISASRANAIIIGNAWRHVWPFAK